MSFCTQWIVSSIELSQVPGIGIGAAFRAPNAGLAKARSDMVFEVMADKGSHKRRSDSRRWTINGDYAALSRFSGVARHAREVVDGIDALIGEQDPLTQGLDLDIVFPNQKCRYSLNNISSRVCQEYSFPRLPQFWVQFQLPGAAPGGLLSFCNLAPIRHNRQIVTMHDLHTRLVPESSSWGFRMAHQTIMPMVGRRADYIATVSEFVRGHLVEFGYSTAEHVVVVSNGADHALRWHANENQIAWPDRPFVLGIGRAFDYKNSELFWKIAPGLASLGIDVAVVGELSDHNVLKFGPLPANLKLFGRISDDALASGLSQALAFVFPSRIEGFGLPAIEAMQFGCPVLASNVPPFPEVCGNAARYIDPDDIAGWVDAIAELSRDPVARHGFIERGHVRAAAFTWRRVAEGYLRLMARVDGLLPALAS